MTVTERRAEFVYDAARLAAIASNAPIVPVPWAERELDFKSQFMNVIDRQCGPQRSSSPEELHGSWMQAYIDMGWVYGEVYDREKKVHPDMVPYSQLGKLEQDKDSVFVALCEIARQWVYELEKTCKYPRCINYSPEAENYCCNGCSWDHDSAREAGYLKHD